MSRLFFSLTSSAYVAALGVMISVGYIYEDVSKGLASPSEAGPFFCNRLQSSGGDDNAMIGSFMLFSVPLAYRLIRHRILPALFELAVFSTCVTLVLFSLWLATMDCAHIFYTAFVVPDPLLATAIIGMAVSISMILLLRRQNGVHPTI